MLDLPRRSKPYHMPRCNVEGNATFPSSRRPKFGIIGVSFIRLVLVISEKTVQVVIAVVEVEAVTSRVVAINAYSELAYRLWALLLELELGTYF